MSISKTLPAVVHARLPRSGLANMLIVSCRAAVFAELNRLRQVSTGWLTPRIGPWLRKETRKRLYASYVRHSGVVELAQLGLLSALGETVREPRVERTDALRAGAVYEFSKLPNHLHYFDDIRAQREICHAHIHGLMSEATRRTYLAGEVPVIGIHVRRGDFRKLAPGQSIANTFAQTPIEHFVDLLSATRRVAGRALPATIFSDGRDDELAPLLAMPNVHRARPENDFVDLLTLSRSRILICSAWSTFSFLAGFLADAPLLLVPVEALGQIRANPVNARWFEGMVHGDVDAWPDLLRDNVRAVAEVD